MNVIGLSSATSWSSDIWWDLGPDKNKMTSTTNCQRELTDFPIAASGRSDPQFMQGGSPSNGAAAGTVGLLNGLNCGTLDVTANANVNLAITFSIPE